MSDKEPTGQSIDDIIDEWRRRGPSAGSFEPTCDYCDNRINWVAFAGWDPGSPMHLLCQRCRERECIDSKVKIDREATRFYGVKRSYFCLEDMTELYKPSYVDMLRLIKFCAWAARQKPVERW